MKFQLPKYEFPVAASAWTNGVGRPAGIFLLDGHFHVAAQDSVAERHLREHGALHVATLRFDADPLERSHPERPVRPLRARAAVAHFVDGVERN